MSIFNLEIQPKAKKIFHHPWERTIKHAYSTKIKYAHNSTNNPQYPKTKKISPNADRIRFTIIGNILTREFNYCVHLLKGLHKYRWKEFDSPVIRGVTSVEWPNVWNELKISHGELAYCLDSQVAILMNDKFLGGEKELKKLIEKKYVYHFHLDYYKEGVREFVKFIRSSGRPCAYMQISIDDEHIGTLIFMLYADIVPHTCENFLRLCKEIKGGYSGTPVHRIVKDCWIQCGGYGLKNTDLGCENFIVPHDRRGVICMANDGRHVDCSTQFFILLQPAPWMEQKYVAFGQLIDGNDTLEKIENVPTWYESPKNNIVIFQSGILNVECDDLSINKGTKEYIHGHVDDLIEVGDMFYEILMEKVFLEIESRYAAQETLEEQYEEEENIDNPAANLRATQRFIRKKVDIEEQIEDGQLENYSTSVASDALKAEADESFIYEADKYSYNHVSLDRTISLAVKPKKLFYLPLTDVPYPGEVDSIYDLKKFLKGDYCLEADLENNAPKKVIAQKRLSPPPETLNLNRESDSETTVQSLDSEDEKEIKEYLKQNADRVSFAGSIIKGIARGIGQYNSPVKGNRKKHKPHTLFAKSEDIKVIDNIEKSEEMLTEEEEFIARKVRIAPSVVETPYFTRAVDIVTSDGQVQMQSALQRLYEDIDLVNNRGPTLKEYKPMIESKKKSILLTYSPIKKIKSNDSREKYLRYSVTIEDDSVEQVLNLQHGKKVTRKISSDYVKTIDQMEHRKLENSIRSIEFSKTRPSMTVSEYQIKNQKHQEEQRAPKI